MWLQAGPAFFRRRVPLACYVIACAMLVWIRLTDIARKTQQTAYRVKHGLLDDYLCQQLKKPSVKMRFA